VAIKILPAYAHHRESQKDNKQSQRGNIEECELKQSNGVSRVISHNHQLHHVQPADDQNRREYGQGSPTQTDGGVGICAGKSAMTVK